MAQSTGWYVRDDAPTAVSLDRIIAMETTGPRYDSQIFVQGAPVPASFVDPILERMDANPPSDPDDPIDGDHMWRFLEHVGEREETFSAPPPPPPLALPAEQVVDWNRADTTTLQAELTKRPHLQLPERGSGANGNVIKADIVKLLTEDDERAAQAARGNPFTQTQ